jgi:hypothetical protein
LSGKGAENKESLDGETLGGFDLSHLWKRSSVKGVCREIPVERKGSKLHSRNPDPSPLNGGDRQWSTLGGDTRWFAQVLRSNPTQGTKMEGREHETQRPFQGEEEQVEVMEVQCRTSSSTLISGRGNYRGGRQPNHHKRQRDQERPQGHQEPRDQQIDLQRNLNQGREEKMVEEGKKSATV